jgi:hypothetical protein
MAKTEIKIGDTFNSLTVIEHIGIKCGKNAYKCVCGCGNISDLIISCAQRL